jgi:AcrR family transcriptional regulator
MLPELLEKDAAMTEGTNPGEDRSADEHDHAGRRTRERILAAALALFARQGYAGSSVRDIAEAVGVTKAALYYHFRSKEEILDALTEPIVAELEALVARAEARPAPPAAELLGTLVDILSRRAALIRALMEDPSAPRHLHRPELHRALSAALAAGPGRPGDLRAWAAIGAAQLAGFVTVKGRAAGAGTPPDEQAAEALLRGDRHLLGVSEREEIVAAALRALGPV